MSIRTFIHSFSSGRTMVLRVDFAKNPPTFDCATQLNPLDVVEYRSWLHAVVVPEITAHASARQMEAFAVKGAEVVKKAAISA